MGDDLHRLSPRVRAARPRAGRQPGADRSMRRSRTGSRRRSSRPRPRRGTSARGRRPRRATRGATRPIQAPCSCAYTRSAILSSRTCWLASCANCRRPCARTRSTRRRMCASAWRYGGFCGAPVDLGARPFVVTLSAMDGTEARIRDLAAHEVAHDLPVARTAARRAPARRVRHRARFRNTPIAKVPAAARMPSACTRAAERRDEHLAAVLARSWGFL